MLALADHKEVGTPDQTIAKLSDGCPKAGARSEVSARQTPAATEGQGHVRLGQECALSLLSLSPRDEYVNCS